MTFETPFTLLVFGFTFGLMIAAAIHYLVWPLKVGRWFKIFGGKLKVLAPVGLLILTTTLSASVTLPDPGMDANGFLHALTNELSPMFGSLIAGVVAFEIIWQSLIWSKKLKA